MNVLEHAYIVECVQRWGNAASIALLDPICKIFSTPELQGIIGYRVQSQCAIVFGDPICPQENILLLVRSFENFCRQKNLRIIYVIVSQPFVNLILKQKKGAALAIGDEIILNPFIDVKGAKGFYGCLLRNKYNHATRDGVEVHEYRENNENLEVAMQEVCKSWLENRKGPQIYLSHIRLFMDRSNKRWFYAQREEEIIGVIMLNRLDAYKGWVLNVLMLKPHSPVGSSELLLLTVIEALRKEGCHFFSAGTVPGELSHIQGLGKISTFIAQLAFKIAQRIFHLKGRQKYWQKFEPRKEPSFLLFDKTSIGISQIRAIMQAYNAKF